MLTEPFHLGKFHKRAPPLCDPSSAEREEPFSWERRGGISPWKSLVAPHMLIQFPVASQSPPTRNNFVFNDIPAFDA